MLSPNHLHRQRFHTLHARRIIQIAFCGFTTSPVTRYTCCRRRCFFRCTLLLHADMYPQQKWCIAYIIQHILALCLRPELHPALQCLSHRKKAIQGATTTTKKTLRTSQRHLKKRRRLMNTAHERKPTPLCHSIQLSADWCIYSLYLSNVPDLAHH